MIRITFVAIILLALTVQGLFSQADFAAGYIITSDNDTIPGFIDQKNYISNSRQCLFKILPESDPTKYGPDDIQAYHFENGKFYVSKTIIQNGDSVRFFLEYLVDGIADIYTLRDMRKDHYFIERSGKGLFELTIEESEIIQKDLFGNDKKLLKTNEKYKGVLRYTFSDDQALYDQINKTSLGAKDLIKIAKAYHRDVCNEYACIDYSREMHANITYGPQAGVIVSWMTMYSSKDYALNIRPIYGIRIGMNPSFLSKNWTLESGLMNSSNHFDRIYSTKLFTKFEKEVRLYDIDVSYDAFRIPLLIKYRFPLKKFQPAVVAGLNNVLLLDRSFEAFKYSPVISYPVDSRFIMYHFGLTGGTELSYHLNEKSEINMCLYFERRVPGSNFRHLMDFQRINAVMLTFGANFKIGKGS